MNDPSLLDASTFWRICDSDNMVCHCDYRLSIQNCVESDAFYYITLVGLIWSSIVSIVGLFLLTWRIFIQKQSLFEIRHKLPRPKPIESMCLFGILFNIVRVVHAAVILTDVGQSPILRLFLFDQCWVLAFSAFTCYVFGVAQTLLNSNRVLYDAWLSSPSVVDAICMIATLLPFIFMNLGAIGSGYYALKNDINSAYVFLRVGYYCAMVYTFILGILIIYAGRRLTGLISDPVLIHSNIRITNTKLQASSFKVKVTVICGSFCLWSMGIIACVYASIRITITTNYILAMLFSSFISFVGPGVTSIIMVALFLSPKVISNLAILNLADDDEPGQYPQFEFNLNGSQRQTEQTQRQSQPNECFSYDSETTFTSNAFLSNRDEKRTANVSNTAYPSSTSSSTKLIYLKSALFKNSGNSQAISTCPSTTSSTDRGSFATWQHINARTFINMENE